MISARFNASDISIPGECPSPGTAIAARPLTGGIASVASALDVAVPETGTLRSGNRTANSPQPLRKVGPSDLSSVAERRGKPGEGGPARQLMVLPAHRRLAEGGWSRGVSSLRSSRLCG
jgi:hypothetical protein